MKFTCSKCGGYLDSRYIVTYPHKESVCVFCLQAELEKKYAENELKVLKDSEGKSDIELLRDAARKGAGPKL